MAVSAVSANDVWAVGYSLIGFTHQTLIEHYDGSSWTIVPSPNPASHNALLNVDAISAGDAWAVGYQDDGNGDRSLVERWNGSTWSVVPIAPEGTVGDVLTAVTMVSSSNVWMVGYSSDGGNYSNLMEHWTGSSFSTVAAPNVDTSTNMLMDISFASATDGWAVGESYMSGDADRYDGLVEHWDGGSWSVVPSANSTTSSSRLLAVSAVPSSGGQVWAAGSKQKGGMVEQYCGSAARSAGDVRAPGPPVQARSLPGRPSAGGLGATAARSPSVVDEASAAGIAQTTNTWGVAVDDYNADGWPDFVYDTHSDGPAKVYTNNKNGTFSETAQFPEFWERLGCDSADVNHDGLPDVYCAQGNNWGTDLHGSELWIQQPDHSFINEADAYGVLDPTGRDRRPVFIDANHDGWPDLGWARPSGRTGCPRLIGCI